MGVPDVGGDGQGGATHQEALAAGWKRRAAVVAMVLVVVGGILALTSGRPVPASGHQGFASIMPALITLVLVFITRDVILALLAGVFVGGLVVGDPNILGRFILPALASKSFATILVVYLWCLGGLIGLWTRTGGAQHFAQWAGQMIVRGPRSAKFFAWLVGIIFHQGGTVSTILAGTTVRPIADREKVSHEETAYIVDSTASPVATLVPLNAWPLYIAGLLVGTIPPFATEQNVVSFFFRSIPFNFYALFALLMTLLFALEKLPWEGRKMRAARQRAREQGLLDGADAQPLTAVELTRVDVPTGYQSGLADFAVPVLVLVGVALTGVFRPLWAGVQVGSLEVFLAGINVPIAEAFGLGVLSAVVLALVKGMSIKDVMGGFMDGCKGVTIGAIILALAVTLGNVSKALGTAAFVVEATQSLVSPVMLPAILLAICMAISFAIGSSWGTYAVVFPLAMPLAYAMHPDPFYLSVVFGAVLGGAVFGDQCSPISDTTILSSLATGCDVMDHVTTQLPLALAAAGLGALASTLLAAFAVS